MWPRSSPEISNGRLTEHEFGRWVEAASSKPYGRDISDRVRD
jgi:hypothetical protein